MNLCRSCGQDFGSVSAFDAHRVGDYAPGDFKRELKGWTPKQGRRCLSIEELAQAGRFAQNAFGRWSLAEALERGRSLREGDSERSAAPSEVAA